VRYGLSHHNLFILSPIYSISIPQTSHRHFPSLARRLGRIFAHAYHHHRLAFESAEAESALYARFLALSRHFDLVPAEFLVIPERNEPGEEDIGRGNGDMGRKNVTLLTRDPDVPIPSPAPTIATQSPSPRIGGRARTDTMYLSGGFLPTRGSPGVSPSRSPRRIPSPMIATLPGEASQDEAALIASQKDTKEDAAAQEGTVSMPLPEGEAPAEGQVPDAKGIPVPLRVPGQVLARDFALEAPLPVALRDPVETDADSTSALIDDMSGEAGGVGTEMEQGEASSGLETPGEDAGTTSSIPDQLSTVPSGSIDLTPAPPYSELALAEPPLPVLAPHMPDAQPELLLEVETVVAPEPEPDPVIIPDEPSTDDDGTGAGRPDEKNGDDGAKEEEEKEEMIAEMATSSVLDAQGETEETSEVENTEKTLPSEDA
jgi:Mob1/phocein family